MWEGTAKISKIFAFLQYTFQKYHQYCRFGTCLVKTPVENANRLKFSALYLNKGWELQTSAEFWSYFRDECIYLCSVLWWHRKGCCSHTSGYKWLLVTSQHGTNCRYY